MRCTFDEIFTSQPERESIAVNTKMSASVHSLGGGSNASGNGGVLIPSSAAPRSPSSSVCSYAGSVNSEILQANKYLMKTLCLAKKSAALPGKADYANLLTSGLGQ